MRFASIIALSALMLASSSAVAKKPMAWPTGIYSNVRMSAETGDLGGMEARFYEENGEHMVEFVWCEGWCNQTYKSKLTRYDNGFEFHYTEQYEGGEGTILSDYHFIAWPDGKKLKISAWQGRESLDYEGKPQVLKRAKTLFGIDVANTNGSQSN